MRKGLPAVKNLGEVSKDLEFDTFEDAEGGPAEPAAAEPEAADVDMQASADGEKEVNEDATTRKPKKVVPPKEDEYVWMWKVCLWLLILFRESTHNTLYSRIWRLPDGHSSCNVSGLYEQVQKCSDLDLRPL